MKRLDPKHCKLVTLLCKISTSGFFRFSNFARRKEHCKDLSCSGPISHVSLQQEKNQTCQDRRFIKESAYSRISSLFSTPIAVHSAFSLLGSEAISKLKSLAFSDESRDKSPLLGLAAAAGA